MSFKKIKFILYDVIFVTLLVSVKQICLVFMDGGATRFEIIAVVGMSFPRRRRSTCFDSDLLSPSVHGF